MSGMWHGLRLLGTARAMLLVAALSIPLWLALLYVCTSRPVRAVLLRMVSDYTPSAFTRTDWKHATAEERGYMVKSLLATNHGLKGLTAAEILQLLGMPDDCGDGDVIYYDIGYLGRKPGEFPAFAYRLHVYLDRNGTVTDAFFTD